MTRANITIAVLAVLILVLCTLCYKGKPLFSGQYVPEIGTVVKGVSKTSIGQKIYAHYYVQLRYFAILEIEPYKGLTDQDNNKIDTFIVKSLFAGLVALTGFFASVVLFVINSGQQASISKSKIVITVTMVIIAGTIIRLFLAVVLYGNYDMNSYEIVTDILTRGGNVYAQTNRYNYSPLWFMILFGLKRIQLAFDIPFHFVVRTFLCCVDLLTLACLILIARIKKLPVTRTAIFFYLSPVSFLVTGYHGQFENLAMLMVLTGIFMYLWLTTRPVLRTVLLWLFATTGMIIKHNTFYELIICLNSSMKRNWIKLSLFVISVAIFLSLFIPYWDMGRKGIIENVFGYSSLFGLYGVTSLFRQPQLKYLFIAAMFVFPFFLKGRDIISQCLLGTLFFLSFTTGISIQYFILPVAIGVLRPSKCFFLYTLAASVFILGSGNTFFVPGFHLFMWNGVWVAAVCWFVAEMRTDNHTTGITDKPLKAGISSRKTRQDRLKTTFMSLG
jgi:hypothetical protein